MGTLDGGKKQMKFMCRGTSVRPHFPLKIFSISHFSLSLSLGRVRKLPFTAPLNAAFIFILIITEPILPHGIL